jgi:broad specificity phosphatase PhoE
MKNVYLIISPHNINNVFIRDNINEPEEVTVEKQILSIAEEKQAENLISSNVIQDVDGIYSSNFVSGMAMAKYMADQANLKIHVDMNLNERKIGIISEPMDTFINKQLHNFDYKERNGESLNIVKKRMSTILKAILKNNKDVIIYSHLYATIALLSNWCQLGFNFEDQAILTYHDNVIIDSTDRNMQLLKLEFNDLNLNKITKLV